MTDTLLDNDFYFFTQQYAVWKTFPGARVRYDFIDRSKGADQLPYDREFLSKFSEHVSVLCDLRFSESEVDYLVDRIPGASDNPYYRSYLLNFSLSRKDLAYDVVDGKLRLSITGHWADVILWQIVLSVISEILCSAYDKKNRLEDCHLSHYGDHTAAKCKQMDGIPFVEFGTRRRRGYLFQHKVISACSDFPHFKGTSNVHFARMFGLDIVGTMAHEWIQGVSGIEGFADANHIALKLWDECFRGRLNVALTDTFGLRAFFDGFDRDLSLLYPGVRQDSGDLIDFIDRMLRHWRFHRENPADKTIYFSDDLNPNKVCRIREHLADNSKMIACIGTNLTNDLNRPVPRIVIKMTEINGVPVVKLGEGEGKESGNPKMIETVRKFFYVKNP